MRAVAVSKPRRAPRLRQPRRLRPRRRVPHAPTPRALRKAARSRRNRFPRRPGPRLPRRPCPRARPPPPKPGRSPVPNMPISASLRRRRVRRLLPSGTVQVGAGTAFVTGYYEPEIAGSRTKRTGYDIPIYRRPADLIDVDLGQFSDDLKGKKIRGRGEGSNFVRYYDRGAIERGALEGRGLEIAWAADAAEFFFLQIQGSGRLRLPDGEVMRIGYDTQNGRDYVGIGKLLADRGELKSGQTSMQGILDYLRADPVRGAAVMNENPSWVFFREIVGPGPLGALGVPVTGRSSVAADPKYTPLGAPVFLSLDRAEPNGLWIAQDTGGAIRGANRFPSFWGAGNDARAIAGGMAGGAAAVV